MFEIIFGLFWTACTAVATYASYFSGSTISVNGQIVSQEEFNEMLIEMQKENVFTKIIKFLKNIFGSKK